MAPSEPPPCGRLRGSSSVQARTKPIDILDQMISEGLELGLGHLSAENERLDGRTLRIGGRDLIHFGSCSYLGLELDPRLKQGAADAALRFGTHFSSSRTYVSDPLYAELEGLLEQIFAAPVVVAQTTTLAHLAALPILCEEDDALILDHQAHHSLRMATNQVRAGGAHVELVRHNRLDLLEERIAELRPRHRRIWYAGDGVYSMYGDLAPMDALVELMGRYEQLHLYLDDAHGVSWCGEHGKGYVLDRMPPHERLVVATTLAKSFGTGGAVLVFPSAEWRRKVRTCGGPLIFAGPLSPPVVGAAIASARIHLSDEIAELQERIRDRIVFCNDLLRSHGLPLVAATEIPVRFVGVGPTRAAQSLGVRLMDEGFYVNVAQFPAVAVKRAGIRFMVNLHQSRDDVRGLVEAMAHHLPETLAAEGASLDDVWRAFHMPPPASAGESPGRGAPESERRATKGGAPAATAAALRLQEEVSIEAITADEWDRCLGTRGSFTWQGLAFLESVFVPYAASVGDSRNRWNFRYYVVRDERARPVLATFFTEAVWKDDMLAPEAVSRLADERRLEDPDFLTSKTFSMGSLLTEGNHLYLDRSRDWRGALSLLLSAVSERADACGARTIALRDLPDRDPELDSLLSHRGFTKLALPESMAIEIDWTDDEEFLARLSPKARRHQRHEVFPWEPAYEVEVLEAGGRVPSREEFAHYHELYRAVKNRNLALNTFDLPETLFERMLTSPAWELVTLRLRPEFGGGPGGLPVAVGACFVGPEQYVPLVLGLDYRYVRSRGLYRQCLLQAVRRAQHHGLQRVLLGMGAPLEKRRFGAGAQQRYLYLQTDDHYPFDVLAELAAEAAS